jgi:hypothetical protein
MAQFVRKTDHKGRVRLPKGFARTTVVIEVVSDTELCIRKETSGLGKPVLFREELVDPLSDKDRDLFLTLLDNPPAPNQALRRAAAEYMRRTRS